MSWNGPLNKIDDYRWEIPQSYKHCMRTSAVIFADEKMIRSIREDNAPEQAANVACLPGIVGKALAMPDIHWGYGFPIGGVAAMDAEEGVISPGGIGFDINCLCEGSKISTDLGGWMGIEDFEREFATEFQANGFTVGLMGSKIRVKTLGDGLSTKRPSAFLKKTSDKKTFRITTKTGLKLQCSEDHPLLTRFGMKEAARLKKGDEVAVNFFEGVELDPRVDRREILLAKIFGYMLGDGSLSRTGKRLNACAYGEKADMERMKKDLSELGYNSEVYLRTRAHAIPTQYGLMEFVATSAELHVHSRAFSNLLIERGMPVGRKTIADFRVPGWIMTAAPTIKRAFIAGLFGAELTAPTTITKTGFAIPTFAQNKNDEHMQSARQFFIDLILILEELGIQTTKISQRKEHYNQRGQTSRIRLLISANEDNLLRLYREIGFEYSIGKSKRAEVAVKYMLLKKEANSRRVRAAERIKELKRKGLKLKEVQKLFADHDINSRFVERHYYENAGQRIPLDFVSFEDFSVAERKQLESTGVLFDEIAVIEEISYRGYVYDFTVPETHNFIANGIVVSNCGVRLVRTNLTVKDVKPGIKDLINILFKNVPAGLGSEGVTEVAAGQIDSILQEGAEWAVHHGYGWEEDLEATEEGGRMKNADPSKVSRKAKERGIPQVGSLGSGNHFLEIDEVDEIYDMEAAKAFGIGQKGQITVTVHCGSRGCGHQIATDYLQVMERYIKESKLEIPDRQLACASVKSNAGMDYFSAMACGANFAWANRQMILHWVRQSFEEHFKRSAESMEMHQVYDVAHNIAKLEEYQVEGKRRKVYVHRKGATRSFPKDHPDVPAKYRSVGQPVIIPGDMGAGSYVLIGTEQVMKEAFGSTCHGAGRLMSRASATRKYNVNEVRLHLESQGIHIRASTKDGILEEAPGAYKNIDDVIAVVKGAGLSKPVARLRPIGVMKG